MYYLCYGFKRIVFKSKQGTHVHYKIKTLSIQIRRTQLTTSSIIDSPCEE